LPAICKHLENKMPFTSSPLIDGDDTGAAGTLIGGGGGSINAHRQQQIEALECAKRREQEEAADIATAQYQAEQQAHQLQRESKEQSRREAWNRRQVRESYATWVIYAFVFAACAYLVFDLLHKNKSQSRRR